MAAGSGEAKGPGGEETAAPHPAAATASDRPLEDPDSDRLGYAPFAEAVAEGIASMQAPDGLVIGVYGAWGLGKTTVLNFIEHYLEERNPDEFVVIQFNPWWFSGRMDIATAFFEQLRSTFMKWETRGEAARKYLANLARVVGAATGTGVGDAVGDIVAGEAADVPELKRELAEALSAQDKRLLIVIDDIDRLTQDEVAELFAVVKALLDFPNTIYILAFDRQQVAKALKGRVGESGFDYLEKIVQVPFELPLPEREALRALFLEHLNEIVGEVDDDLLDRADWTGTLSVGIEPLIATPRDIVRLTNSLRVTYAAVKGEVNVVDFIALETLRVFEPAVYELIRSRPEMFGAPVGWEHLLGDIKLDEKKAFHREWLSHVDVDHRRAVRELVMRLFPRAAALMDDTPLLRGRGDSRRTRRIAEPEFFPLYFRFGLADRIISREVIAEMLHRAEDPDAFGQALVNMADSRLPSGRTRASVMLDELIGQAEKGFAQEHIAGVVGSLIDIGDRLWIGTDNDRNPFGTDNPSRITALVGDLLRRLSDDDRLPTMMKAVEGAASVTTPVLIVRRLESGLGVPVEKSIGELSPGQVQEEGGFVTATGALQLEQSAVHRIKEGAQRDELLAAPKLLYVLGEWTRWGDLADVKAWMDSVRSDDRQLARFLLAVRSLHVSERRRYYRINPRWFDGYVIPHELAKDVSRLAQAAEGETRECCDQFLKELQLIDAGKNPDELFDEDWA